MQNYVGLDGVIVDGGKLVVPYIPAAPGFQILGDPKWCKVFLYLLQVCKERVGLDVVIFRLNPVW